MKTRARCLASNQAGLPCGNRPGPGHKYCVSHRHHYVLNDFPTELFVPRPPTPEDDFNAAMVRQAEAIEALRAMLGARLDRVQEQLISLLEAQQVPREQPEPLNFGKRRELNPPMNAREAAAHTGLSVGTIRSAVQRREMDAHRSGERGPFSVRLAELERWFAWKRPVVPALDWPRP